MPGAPVGLPWPVWRPPPDSKTEGRRGLAPIRSRCSSAPVVKGGLLAQPQAHRHWGDPRLRHRTYCAALGCASTMSGLRGVEPLQSRGGRQMSSPRRTHTRRGSLPASTSYGLGALRFRPSACCARVFNQPSGRPCFFFQLPCGSPGSSRMTQQTFTRFDSQYGLPALSEYWWVLTDSNRRPGA